MEQGGGKAGHCLFALEVNCSLKIKHPASRGREGGAFNMI